MGGWRGSKFDVDGLGGVGQKNEVQQKNGMGLNVLLFNHSL